MSAASSMSGKVCVVTGANAGIGAVTARELAREGARVVLVGRDRDRCAARAEQIRAETGNPEVSYRLADLSVQAEVRRLAGELREDCPRIDVLVNNAGAIFADRLESADGIEMTFALNHLGYFLLTHLLLDRLQASAPSRIVNVSSEAHRPARLNFDDLQARRSYRAFREYGRSKLANLLFTYELSRRLAGSGVTVNALHPGFVRTEFFDGNGALGWFMRLGAATVAIPVEEGARTSIHLATSPEVEGVTGSYFMKCRPARSSSASLDQDAARRLWKISADLTGVPDQA